MRFLADENFPGDAVAALRAADHDVLWVRTDAPGAMLRVDSLALRRRYLDDAALGGPHNRRGGSR
jgi:hypothetical protein